jgi:hypothetical protein
VGDVFLAGLLLPAMALHEELRIEAPVSEDLADAAEGLVPMLLRWFPRLARAEVHAERADHGSNSSRGVAVATAATTESAAVGATTPDPRGTGCFFSAGVDSFHSLVTHDERVSHLLIIHGFEIEPDNRALWAAATDNVQEVAQRWNKTLVPLSTNLMEIGSRETQRRLERQGNPYRNFGVNAYFGAMLVATGLVLRGALRELIVPASWPYEYTHPNGSHPLLEPRWSTPGMVVRLAGCEADRLQKIRLLAERAPEAFRHLRVCVDNATAQLNCDHCIKCVRTLMEMRAVGALDLAATFPAPLDVAAVKRMRFPTENHFLPALLAEAERIGDTELADTTAILLGRKRHWPRELDRARDALAAFSPRHEAWRVKEWLKRSVSR